MWSRKSLGVPNDLSFLSPYSNSCCGMQVLAAACSTPLGNLPNACCLRARKACGLAEKGSLARQDLPWRIGFSGRDRGQLALSVMTLGEKEAVNTAAVGDGPVRRVDGVTHRSREGAERGRVSGKKRARMAATGVDCGRGMAALMGPFERSRAIAEGCEKSRKGA